MSIKEIIKPLDVEFHIVGCSINHLTLKFNLELRKQCKKLMKNRSNTPALSYQLIRFALANLFLVARIKKLSGGHLLQLSTQKQINELIANKNIE